MRNPKRRGNGQGSVYQRPGKGWVAAKTIGYKLMPDGGVRQIVKTKCGFRTKTQALAHLAQMTDEAAVKKEPTFQQLYQTWEPTHKAGASTMTCYRAAFKHYAPVWQAKVKDITIDDLQECLDDCDKGKRTKENMKALAGLLYKYAIPRGIAPLNLGQYLVIKAESGSSKPALPPEAIAALEASSSTGAAYILCQCFLGFRPAEFLALDVLSYSRKEKAFRGGSKTDAGRDRVVPVSPKIQPIIDRLVKDKISGPVFCAPDGKPLSIEAYRALFYRTLAECGIDNPATVRDGVSYHKYTPHSCRHTFATMMKRVSGSDKDKLALIGHTSTEMLRHYQDAPLDDLRRIINAI